MPDTLADRFFAADRAYKALEDEADEALMRAAGIDYDDATTWPLKDTSYDEYDGSFEWHGVREGWTIPPCAIEAWRDLGFARCWVNFEDGSELYVDLRTGEAMVARKSYREREEDAS